MIGKTLVNLEEKYGLELDRIVLEVKKRKAKTVLLQLPDGLKPWGPTISDYLEERTGAKINIWLGVCFGACDLPNSDADLVVQFGHAPWE
ncbi:diphthamide synthesis protein [Candidatus Pacearchaeota archaeon]|nr:diphthamide synthesis protein [Candidatus Pacearchaeota archaeon]